MEIDPVRVQRESLNHFHFSQFILSEKSEKSELTKISYPQNFPVFFGNSTLISQKQKHTYSRPGVFSFVVSLLVGSFRNHPNSCGSWKALPFARELGLLPNRDDYDYGEVPETQPGEIPIRRQVFRAPVWKWSLRLEELMFVEHVFFKPSWKRWWPGGFWMICIFTPTRYTWGNYSIWLIVFQIGLKPPTSGVME